MCKFFDIFLRIEAYDGFYFIRRDLIKSISYCTQRKYIGDQDAVDVQTQLLYDNGEIFYFKEDIFTVVRNLKIQFDKEREVL